MATQKIFTRTQRFAAAMETFLMSYLVPKERVGPIFSVLFKPPLLFYKLGLQALIPEFVLILTTRGRRTGLERQTPVGYSYDDQRNAYVLMSGWEGRTDWYRNAEVDKRVKVWVKGWAPSLCRHSGSSSAIEPSRVHLKVVSLAFSQK